MKSHVSVALIALLCVLTCSALAKEVYDFDSEADRDRFHRFTYELRCPKCQSQNLAGSDSQISQDLKREVHRLIVEGKTDDEILDFMVTRYGDFVLYRPQFQSTTWLLWLGPLVLILIGLGVFGWVLFRKMAAQTDDE